MDDPNRAPTQSTLSLAARAGWAALIIVTLYVCYFSHLGALGFVGPDEPRYAWVAREMVESGDWVTPRLYGKPWFEKPVLYYWGAALSFKLFGVSEASARLPSAISALLATLAMAWLAWRIYGAETARWLLLLLPTTVGMIGFSHAAAMDMPFTGMLTIAMVAAAVALGLTRTAQDPSPAPTPWLALISFGVFLGAAALAKGPAALVLCGGAVLFWALFTRRWRDAFRLLHPAAISSFCVTALPWYILCARHNPDFFRVFIIEHNFQRYLTPEFQHVQPFWFYAPVLLLGVLPWAGILLWTAGYGIFRIIRKESLRPETVFLLAWAFFCVVFFSASHSKLPGYSLPAIPAVVLILARSCTSAALDRRRSFGYSILFLAIVSFGLSQLVNWSRSHHARGIERFEQYGLAIEILILAISAAGLFLGCGYLFGVRKAAPRLALWLSVLPILAPLYFSYSGRWENLLWYPAARSISQTIDSKQIPISKLFLSSVDRSTRSGLNFYLRTELRDWNQDPAAEAYVLSGRLRCSQLKSKGFDCVAIELGPRVDDWFLSHVVPKGASVRLKDGKQTNE